MTKAVLGVGFDGGEAESGLDRLDKKLDSVGKSAESLTNKLRGWLKQNQELWNDPVKAKGDWSNAERLRMSFYKASADILKGQVGAAADAVIAPAKTSYAGAIAVANQYRDTTQRIATSTGRNYYEIGAQIDSSAKRLGLMPERVQRYASAVADLTGDWGSAISGLDAYQNRALRTNRTLEEFMGVQAELTNVFGIEGTDAADKFFGTIERQAAAAKVSGRQVERVFIDLAGTLSQITSADPSNLTAIGATMLQGAGGNVGRAERRTAGLMGFIDQHSWWLEAQAKKRGVLKKGESFFDEQGLQKDPIKMIEFLQSEVKRTSKGKITGDQVSYLQAMYGMSREVAAGIVNFDAKKARTLAGQTGAPADALADYMASAAGGRTAADVAKNMRDRRFGDTFLGAQDWAVSKGGGASGVALSSSGQIFDRATGVFADAVNLFIKGTTGGGAASAVGGVQSTVGTTLGTALGQAASGAATTAIVAATLPIAMMAAVAYFGYKDITSQEKDYEKAREQEKEEKKQAESQGMDVVAFRRMRKRMAKLNEGVTNDQPLQMMDLPGPWAPGFDPHSYKPTTTQAGGGIDVQAGAQAHAAEMAKMLDGKTLRVQLAQPPPSPPGQPQPS